MITTPHIRSRLVGANIPPAERVVTALLGSAAIGIGVRRWSMSGLALAGLGAIAMLRALVGRCPVYRMRAVRKGVQVRKAITIQATRHEIYMMLRDLTNLPRFMYHVKSVTLEQGGVSRWVVCEGFKELEWRAKIVEDTPDRRLRWKSLPGGDIEHEGTLDLREAPGDRGTIVDVKLHYLPPGGVAAAGALYGFLHGIAELQIGEELARLRQLIETGEIAVGERRLEDLCDDTAMSAAYVAPPPPQPIMTAGTSGWKMGSVRR